MNGNATEHIGLVELAKLLEESRRPADTVLDAANMHPHLGACSTCREQFEKLVWLDRLMTSARPAESERLPDDCPDTKVWREIAGGVTLPNESHALEHASQCDHCGPLLREALAELADLNAELTREEREKIASLESANPEWQRRLAHRIASMPDPAPGGESASWRRRWRLNWFSVPRLAAAGAFLLLVGVASWVVLDRSQLYQNLVHRHQPATAARFLARAYTQQRTFELRIAGAAYAPVRVLRGPATSFTTRPPALLRAEALIASQLASHPSDSSWLRAEAQADLLEGKYDAAVESLRRALESEPHSPALLTDLATAYFQRAQQNDRKEDLAGAYEYLSQALKLQPEDPVALFNRAIVAEHLFLYHQALEDWDHYLRLDGGSQWAEEARGRADAVREKLKEHGGNAAPLLSPAQIAGLGGGAMSAPEIDQRIEEYLLEAVRSWLPQAFPEAGANRDPNAAQALFFLSDVTSQQHGDHWLPDLLAGSSAPNFPQAVAALARANQANFAGEYDVSRQQADLAERVFRASGNMAGVLRTQFEETFAAQMTRRSEECRRQSTTARAESEKHSYSWLQIQLELEKSVCSGLMGDLGSEQTDARRAMERAQQSGYGALYLRALGFLAGDRRDTGNLSESWKLVSMGLGRYWSGQFPARRGYNLYTELGGLAEANARPHLQMQSWREAAAVIDRDENLLMRAWAHNYIANAATSLHEPEIAQREYAEAARLFDLAPRAEASRTYALESEIRTARVEAGLNRFDAAMMRLTSIQDQIRSLSNNYLVQMFYSTLGEAQLRGHHAPEAEQAFLPALRLAEQNLASLTSEADRTRWSKDAAPVYMGLVEAELVQGRDQDSLSVFEWYLDTPQRVTAGSRRLTAPPIPHPSSMASRLSLLASETVLAYAALPDGLAIWVYDDSGINARWISNPTDGLQELAGEFHDLSSDPGSELTALRRDARSLYRALIAPVEQYLAPGRTLVIEADGWLARVPFEALLDLNDHYLIERAPIVHSLGQDLQVRLRSDASISTDSPALVVGSSASSPEDGLMPLPDVAAEADAVAGGFHSARVLKGREATLSAVRNELPGAAVFHFAGHSLATPQRTGLLLESGDGKDNTSLMNATVVRQLRLPGLRLAVLSACGTASGSGGSSGFDSVTDALLRAGVPHVIASRWAVDSGETQRFVQDFYRNALSGQSISNAVRLTSRKMLANPRTSHPYYWSVFAAYGRP